MTDRDEERVADEVEDFAPSIASTIPTEPCFAVEKRLQAFERGERQHRQMSIVAAGPDDDTIRDLAAWYEAMRVTVEVPEL